MNRAKRKKIIILSATYLLLHDEVVQKMRRKRRWWMTALFRKQAEFSASHLLTELSSENSGHFENFTRMSRRDFEKLLQLIEPRIQKKNTYFRETIPARERLSVTLRFLATGDSFRSLSYTFRFSKQVISTIIPEVCEALIEALKDTIKTPNCPEEWLKLSDDFYRLWNFPHCLGAFDGKHIGILAPKNSGSDFFNYKSFFSIVLMAGVDANYKFIYADVGCQGRISDGGVFKNTSFYHDLEAHSLGLPNPEPLPATDIIAPYIFVADDAFPLKENIMKPYPGSWPKGTKERALNYRLSRARRIVENVFGIMSSVFRVLRKPMLLEPKKATLVTLACVYLHNFLQNSKYSANMYAPPGSVDIYENGELIEGTWRRDSQELTSFLPLQNLPRRSPEYVKEIRDTFAKYCKEHRVPWQDKYE